MGLSSLFTSMRSNRHHNDSVHHPHQHVPHVHPAHHHPQHHPHPHPHHAHLPHHHLNYAHHAHHHHHPHHVLPSPPPAPPPAAPPPPPPNHSASPPNSFRFSPPRRARHNNNTTTNNNNYPATQHPSPTPVSPSGPRSLRHFRRLRQNSSMSSAATAAAPVHHGSVDASAHAPSSVSSRRVYSTTRYAAGYDPSQPDHYPTPATPDYISMDSRSNLQSSPPSPTFLPHHTPVTDRPKTKSHKHSANSSSTTTVSSSLHSGGNHHRRRRNLSDMIRSNFAPGKHQRRPYDKSRVSDEDGPHSSAPPTVLIEPIDGPISLPLTPITPVDAVLSEHDYDAIAGGTHDPTRLGPYIRVSDIATSNPHSGSQRQNRHRAQFQTISRPSRPRNVHLNPPTPKSSRIPPDTSRPIPDRPAPTHKTVDSDPPHPFRVPSPTNPSSILFAPPLRLPQTLEPPSERVSTDSGTQRTSDDVHSVSNGSVPSSPRQRMRAPVPKASNKTRRPRPPPLIINPNNSPGFSRGGYPDERLTAPSTPRPTTPIIPAVHKVIPKNDVSNHNTHNTSSVTEDSDQNDANSPRPPLANKPDGPSDGGGNVDGEPEPIAYTGNKMMDFYNDARGPREDAKDMKYAGLSRLKANNSMDLEPLKDVKNGMSADLNGPIHNGVGGWTSELAPVPHSDGVDEVTEDDFRLEGDLDGGFIFHDSGLIEPPEHVTRKMSDGLAVEGIPTSSNKLIIVRSLNEFQESFVFKSSTQSNSNNEPANGVRKTLGRGAAGRVYLAVHKPSKRKIAVKEINFLDMNKREQLRKELITLISHQSRFLVKSYGAFYDDKGRVHVTLEYMDRGSLADVICHVGKIPENVVVKIAEHCLRGLHFLHSNHILHRDVKTGNILLSQKLCRAKLSDFGLARDLKEGQGINSSSTDGESNSVTNTFVGTVAYMSPERLKGKKYTYASDIWALGISILECVLGRSPFVDMQHYFDYVEAAVSIPADLVRGQVSDDLYDFLRRMTDEDENNRPRAIELLEHRWIVNSAKNSHTFRNWLRSLPQLESGKKEREKDRRSSREKEWQGNDSHVNNNSNKTWGKHSTKARASKSSKQSSASSSSKR